MNEQQPTDERKCQCGHPQRWVEDLLCPIQFDEETGEYQIVHNGARIFMEYCFKCGGRLPESKRGSFFTTPDAKEMAEIDELLRDARSVADMIRILGVPDCVHKGAVDTNSDSISSAPPPDGQVIPWKQQLDYGERWTSLTLFIHENLDGSVDYVIGGRELSSGR